MKKKDLKSLKLNKKTISKFERMNIKGQAAAISDWSLSSSWCCIIKNFTEGDCVDTLGDDHCWTPTPGTGW